MSTNSYSIAIILLLGFFPLFLHLTRLLFDLIIKKSKESRKFKNEAASLTYMLINFAPGISSYSVVSAITENDKEDKITLWIIFVLGIFVHYFGRKLRDSLFEKTKKEIVGFKKSDYEKVMKGGRDEIKSKIS